METKDGIKTTKAKDAAQWRRWLEINHETEKSVWLIMFKKGSGTSSINWDLAVDEALCFGWIDGKRIKGDETCFYQFFTKRKPKSNWSKVNRGKIERLMIQGRMTKTGLEMVELAKQTGTWTALDEVENHTISVELQIALNKYPNAEANFLKFPRSVKRNILEWILNAKTDVTRQKRVNETALLANDNIRANQYRK